MSDRAELLEDTDAFGGLNNEARIELAGLAVERHLKRGETIYAPGDQGASLFVIHEGVVRSALPGPDDRYFAHARMERPTVFGHLAVLDAGQRDAHASAATAVTLLEFGREDLLAFLREHPETLDGLFRAMGRLVRRAGALITDLAFLDAQARLARRILQLANPAGEVVDLVRQRRVSQSELASMIGTSRQTVNQLLKSFENAGSIEFVGDGIRVTSVELLEKLSTGTLP